ncbi:hypothetical protein DFH06DRAFT_518532 [Mycena polygramma]|nr:hypothetical protein DFH06DRAFT_518532 [Mycena polygramma]
MDGLGLCHRCGVVVAGDTDTPATSATELAPEAQPWFSADPETRQPILLNSNEPPLDSDVPVVQSAISQADRRLARLGNEIAQLRDRLQRLEEERDRLSSSRARICAILSPLRRMPPEVLSEIFGWTLPLGKDSLKRRKFRITDSPWVFTHVSCRWRAVAVRNPLLWSLVAITYSDTDPSTAYPLPMVETQISRAHTFKIHFHGYESSDSRPQFQILQCLAKHASRWEELSLTVTSGFSPLLEGLRGRVPVLRRLYIQWDTRKGQTAVDSVDCFESAPSLVDVSVNNEFRIIPFSFPAQQFTRYELDAPWAMHRGILKLTQNLVEACITVSFDKNPWPQPGEVLELLYLRRLYVSDPFALTFLKFPLLDEIALYLHPNHDGRGLAHLESSVARSLCPIRKLCI